MTRKRPTVRQSLEERFGKPKTKQVGVREKRFYQRRVWKLLRRRVLREAPLCADPFGVHAKTGRPIFAQHVDHIEPIRDRPDLALERSNLQGLCASCHSRKTNMEGGVRYL